MNGDLHQISRDPTTPDFVSQQEILLYLIASPPGGCRIQLNPIGDNCTLHVSGTDRPAAAVHQTTVVAATVRILEPTGNEATSPVILYTRDAGWSFRDAHTHDRGVRYLDLGAHTEAPSPDHESAVEIGSPKALACGVP